MADEAMVDVRTVEGKRRINAHEAAGRALKTKLLVTEIDAAFTAAGVDPVSGYALKMAEAFGEKEWEAISRSARVWPPSETTKAEIVAVYRARVVALKRLSAQCGQEIERTAKAVTP